MSEEKRDVVQMPPRDTSDDWKYPLTKVDPTPTPSGEAENLLCAECDFTGDQESLDMHFRAMHREKLMRPKAEPAQPAQPPICSICRVRVDQCEHAPAGTQAKYICRDCGAKYYDKVEPKFPKCAKCLGVCEPSPATETAREWPQDIRNVTLDPQICVEAQEYLETTARSEGKLAEWLAYFAEQIAKSYHAAQSAADTSLSVLELAKKWSANDSLWTTQGMAEAALVMFAYHVSAALRAERDELLDERSDWVVDENSWKHAAIKQQKRAQEAIAERDEALRKVKQFESGVLLGMRWQDRAEAAERQVAELPKWISVKDRLPERTADGPRPWYLVTNGSRCDVAMLMPKTAGFMGHALQFGEITHWQQLPAPPTSVGMGPSPNDAVAGESKEKGLAQAKKES